MKLIGISLENHLNIKKNIMTMCFSPANLQLQKQFYSKHDFLAMTICFIIGADRIS